MELRKAADALLRSQASPLTSLLVVSKPLRWQAGAQFCYMAASIPTRRAFIASSRNNALKPQPTTSATPPPPEGATKITSESIDDTAKSLGWINPSPKPRFGTSPFSKSSPTSSNLSTDRDLEREKRMNGGNTAMDLLREINKRNTQPSSGFDISRMLDPNSPISSDQELMQDISKGAMAVPKPPPRIPLRLQPSTGRSVTIGVGIDVGRGFRLLEQSCARNKVRTDFTRQRFHERGGLKRKRLRRERWRKRFMEGFKATVGRVKQLKNQGW